MSDTAAASSPPSVSLIADVVARLSGESDVVNKVEGVLGHLQTSLGAVEVSLWLYGPTGLVRSARAGDATTGDVEITQALELPDVTDATFLVRRLLSHGRKLGAIAVRSASPLPRDTAIVMTAVAHLLAAELAHVQEMRQLQAQLESRAREIDDQRRFTEQIIDSLPVGLYVIDREYRVKAWNRKRETGMQGISREEALGRTIFEILHRAPAEMLRREFDEVFRTGRIQQFNMESKATGEVRTYRITKIPMRLNDAAITHLITIGEDVTDWTAAQERFAQSEKLAAIGQLAAGVMHEVNNPLATIAACAESLTLRLDDVRENKGEVTPQTMEFLRIIDNEVHRCKGIIDGLLDFSRPKPVKKERTHVNGVIDQSLFLLKHHARFKKLQVKTQLEAELEPVQANSEQLVQVFMALLINAADSMEDVGTITIRTRRGLSRNEAVVAEVIDEGHGISRSDMAKIFEPFFTTKAPGRGTGLGLSICYGIISDHSGRIEVDSAVGAGSTFRLLLPAAPEPA
jgi:two-component system NtrC family sensor kinase